jgi:hypothetical protein
MYCLPQILISVWWCLTIANPRDSGPPAPQQLQKDVQTLEHLGHTAKALEIFQTAILWLAENNDRHDLYMRELNRKLVAISEGETNTPDDDRMRTDDHFAAIESKIDVLLQKMDATWTENMALREAYRASREETAALKAAVDTLMKKPDETIAISTPPSPETATSPQVTPHSNGDPPPAFATTSTETIDFSIGCRFAALNYVSLCISREFYVDVVEFCREIRVFMRFGLPHHAKCHPNIANSAPHDPNRLGTRSKLLWTLRTMETTFPLMEEMDQPMEVITTLL